MITHQTNASATKLTGELADRATIFDHSAKVELLPLFKHAKACLKKAGISSSSDLIPLNQTDLMNIKDMHVAACEEVLAYIEFSSLAINTDNKQIPLVLLENICISSQDMEYFQINCYKTTDDLSFCKMSLQEYHIIRPAVQFLSVSVITHFKRAVADLKDIAKLCMMRRYDGETLQEIGFELGITRERVRQIIRDTCQSLNKTADLVASVLIISFDGSFSSLNLQNILSEELLFRCCKIVLKKSQYVTYLASADKFIRAEICQSDTSDILI